MKIVITGASGFVGAQLVRLLSPRHRILAVGRNEARLRARFPEIECGGYADLARQAAGFDVLLHCAAVNSDSLLRDADVFAANVGLTGQLGREAAAAGIRRFIFFSSVHALDAGNQSAYARSKRGGAALLADFRDIERVETIYLPLVYGDSWSGRLKPLNSLPKGLARALFRPLAALKPTVHIGKIAEFIENEPAAFPEEILADDQSANFFYVATMRMVDLLFSLGVILFGALPLLLVAAIIRLQSTGPAILAQERVGRKKRKFILYKFRTMKQGTIQAASHEVPASSITGIGHLLRRTKVDELPQVLNILRNEIGLVGPRPSLASQSELLKQRSARGVYELKPGITGLAQINDIDMRDPSVLAIWDARYGKLRSVLLDFRIIFATLFGRGRGDRTMSG